MSFNGWKKNTTTNDTFVYQNLYGKGAIAIDDLGQGIVNGTFDKYPDDNNIDGQATVITIVYAAGWKTQIFISPHGIYKIWVRKSYSSSTSWQAWRAITLDTI